MRDYSKISPQIWIGETGRMLRGQLEAQIVALYLLSNPHANMLGLYYLPLMFIAHETGLPFEGASKGLQRCIEAQFCGYDEASEMVWVFEMARFQVAGQLKPDDKRCIGIQNEYNDLPQTRFLPEFYEKYASAFHLARRRNHPSPFEAPSKPLRSQEQEQEQEQEQKQKPPSGVQGEAVAAAPLGGVGKAKGSRRTRAERLAGYRPEVVALVNRLHPQWPTERADGSKLDNDPVDTASNIERIQAEHPDVALDELEAGALEWLSAPKDYPNAMPHWFGPGKRGGPEPPWRRAVRAIRSRDQAPDEIAS